MKDSASILAHLNHILQNVDGLVWLLSETNGVRNFQSQLDLSFKNVMLLKRPGRGQVAIAIAEAGLINCRKLYEFLGITVHSRKHHLQQTIPKSKPYPEDTDIEDLGLTKVTLSDLAAFQPNNPQLQTAVAHTLLASNKGVAHFTIGAVEGARYDHSLLCALAGLWLAENHVYRTIPSSDYKVWTS